jgi:threonine/homoserine/homoserine lactone efflux protein
MNDRSWGAILLVVGSYMTIVGLWNKRSLFSTSISHPGAYYPAWLRRIVTILTGVFLLLIGIKMILS